jgi:hypothetical protein
MAMESHKLCRNSDLLIDLDAEEKVMVSKKYMNLTLSIKKISKYAFPLLYEIDELEQRLYDLEVASL